MVSKHKWLSTGRLCYTNIPRKFTYLLIFKPNAWIFTSELSPLVKLDFLKHQATWFRSYPLLLSSTTLITAYFIQIDRNNTIFSTLWYMYNALLKLYFMSLRMTILTPLADFYMQAWRNWKLLQVWVVTNKCGTYFSSVCLCSSFAGWLSGQDNVKYRICDISVKYRICDVFTWNGKCFMWGNLQYRCV
jgi:hypothetical protein